MYQAKILAFVAIFLTIFFVHADWKQESIGNVRYTHFYYEDKVLKGVCVATEEGVLALLDHKTGATIWRNYPSGGRRLQRFVVEGRCIFA